MKAVLDFVEWCASIIHSIFNIVCAMTGVSYKTRESGQTVKHSLLLVLLLREQLSV